MIVSKRIRFSIYSFLSYVPGKGLSTTNKGVRKDNVVDSVQVIHAQKHKGVGVRRDCVEHMVLPRSIQKTLLFSSPCLCGSLTHSSPRSTECLLCPRYEDS